MRFFSQNDSVEYLTDLNECSCSSPDKSGDIWMMLNGDIHDGTILIDMLQDIARGFRVLVIFTQCCFEIFDNFGCGTLRSFPLDPPQFLRCQPFREGSIRAFTDFRC